MIELLVVLVLLDLLAIATLHSALHARRMARHLAHTGQVDLSRLEAVRLAAAAPSCRDASSPVAIPLSLPGTSHRPPVTVLIRCGR